MCAMASADFVHRGPFHVYAGVQWCLLLIFRTRRCSLIARPTSLVRSVVTAVLPLAMIACAAPTTPNAAEQTPSTTSAPAASQAAPSETVLYLQQDYSPQLQPINPVTLADATNRTSFVLDGAFPYTQPQFFMSRDGGTVVALDGDRVRELDGASGTQ